MNTPSTSNKTRIAIAIIVVIGAILLAIILMSGEKASESPDSEKAGHSEAAEHDDDKADAHGQQHIDAPKKGPHGGSLFVQGNLGVEVLLAEQNGEARHQLWAYENGKPVSPSAFAATGQVRRPQGEVLD